VCSLQIDSHVRHLQSQIALAQKSQTTQIRNMLEIAKKLLVFQGLYPSIILKSQGKLKQVKFQTVFSIALVVLTLYNIFRSIKTFVDIAHIADYGAGGPTVAYSSVAIELLMQLANFATRVYCLVRVSFSPDLPDTLNRHVHFCRMLRESINCPNFQNSSLLSLSSKKLNRIGFSVASTAEYLLLIYAQVVLPAVSGGMSTLLSLGYIFSNSFVLDVVGFSAVIYMDFLSQSLKTIRGGIKRSLNFEVDKDDTDEGLIDMTLTSTPSSSSQSPDIKINKNRLFNTTEDKTELKALNEFMLNDLKHCMFRLKEDGSIPSSDPVALYEELTKLWDSSKDIWGCVFFLFISTSATRLVSVTFHLISATIDLGSPFHQVSLYFYINCFFLWLKLIGFTNCAEEVQNQVSKTVDCSITHNG